MIISSGIKVYVSRDRVDLRKSYQGLSVFVHNTLRLDPLSGHLFVFFNKALDKVKILYWDRDGLCIWQKRLEKSRFKHYHFEALYWQLSFRDLHLLLSGMDIRQLPQVGSLNKFMVS